MQNYIGDNINAFRTDRGLSQEELAKIAGVRQSAVSLWECGEATPRRSNINKLLKAFPELSADDIYSKDTGYARKVLREPAGVEVPLYGSVAAGQALEMLPVLDSVLLKTSIRKRYPKAFFLKVKGESMNRAIPNGCYVLINPEETAIDGKIYAVCIGSSEATLKRVHLLNNGIELQPYSTDPTFKPQLFDYNEANEETITIIGRAVWFCSPPGMEL